MFNSKKNITIINAPKHPHLSSLVHMYMITANINKSNKNFIYEKVLLFRPHEEYQQSYFSPPIQNKRRSHTRNLSFRPRPSHCLSNVRISSWYSPAPCVYMIQTLLPSIQYHHSYWGMTVLKQRGCVCSCTHPRTFTAPLCSLRRH